MVVNTIRNNSSAALHHVIQALLAASSENDITCRPVALEWTLLGSALLQGEVQVQRQGKVVLFDIRGWPGIPS